MNPTLQAIEKDAKQGIASAGTIEELEKLRVSFLGRKGALTDVLRGLASMPIEERKATGEQANRLRMALEADIDARMNELKNQAIANEIASSRVDISPMLAYNFPQGHFHPLRQTMDEMSSIFQTLGFSLAEGPEIETDWYNFEALNIPP
jgi:phenylalanyl-tRNA synthetase alpha chain